MTNWGCVFPINQKIYFWQPEMNRPSLLVERSELISGLCGRINTQTNAAEILDVGYPSGIVRLNADEEIKYSFNGSIGQIAWEDDASNKIIGVGAIEIEEECDEALKWRRAFCYNYQPPKEIDFHSRVHRIGLMPLIRIDQNFYWANNGSVYEGQNAEKIIFTKLVDSQTLLVNPQNQHLLIISYHNEEIDPNGAGIIDIFTNETISFIDVDKFGFPRFASYVLVNGEWKLVYIGYSHDNERGYHFSLLDVSQARSNATGEIITKFAEECPWQYLANQIFAADLEVMASIPAIKKILA